MDPESLEREIRVFLSEELGLEGGSLDRHYELLSTGTIDSADLVRLATFVERCAGIEVPDRDINASHFDSIAKVVAYVEARRAG